MVIVTSSPRYFQYDFSPQCRLQVLDSLCNTGDCRSTIGACCKPLWRYFNLYKYSQVLHRCKTAGFGYLAFQSDVWEKHWYIFFYLHSHLEHLVFAKIMNKHVVLRLYIESICSYKLIMLYGPPQNLPNLFLLNFRRSPFFFFRPDGWTYLPASGPAF